MAYRVLNKDALSLLCRDVPRPFTHAQQLFILAGCCGWLVWLGLLVVVVVFFRERRRLRESGLIRAK